MSRALILSRKASRDLCSLRILKAPLSPLFARHSTSRRIRDIGAAADAALNEADYLVLNRILGILKLISNFDKTATVPDWLVYDFYTPFVLTNLRGENTKWREIDEYFGVARRLAYLNRDTNSESIRRLPVALSPLISTLSDAGELTRERLAQSREIIAAFEHTVYERFYHAPAARRAIAVVSSYLFEFLKSRHNHWHEIETWLFKSALDDVLNVQDVSSLVQRAETIGSISLRSFFLSLHSRFAATENALSDAIKGLSAAVTPIAVGANVYRPPESRHMLEPDHAYIDAYSIGSASSQQTGRFLRWAAARFDETGEDNVLATFIKPDAETGVTWVCYAA